MITAITKTWWDESMTGDLQSMAINCLGGTGKEEEARGLLFVFKKNQLGTAVFEEY